MHIERVLCAPGRTGFFFDDQKAIKGGAVADGQAYRGDPVTYGFSAVRQAGESISILIELSDGQIAHGDCAAVQYSGVGGRDPLFLAEHYIPLIEKEVAPLLAGRPLEEFRPLAKAVEDHWVGGKRMHTAIRYGVSQALLDAVAKAQHRLMCEVVAKEYGTEVSKTMIPIFTQSGDNRYDNADKMILKHASVLPHGLINNLDAKLGRDGEKLRGYVEWLARRIEALRMEPDYRPVLHLDVYGTIGQLFGVNRYEAMAEAELGFGH
ncbi:MAG TPA: methylaspartate ammonia-lyase, partial [Clostridia bacterium]|nr:methylaspartate ammonia-lyase [Clostridia bacterium]